ncbi:unnamed protein product [Gongylonema pulchrum]|uniref:Alpha/beta hydrolase n=1 Tax=Gongylonema pulchrum TaxID=637853 RepID=A0A183D942_9BILA|nr:unnamed protein product [Gongylonema pulchrum]
MIVIDLTAPFEIWNTYYTLLGDAQKIAMDALRDLSGRSPGLYDTFINNSKMRFKDHQDAELINPFPIPLVLVGAKYDEFQVLCHIGLP